MSAETLKNVRETARRKDGVWLYRPVQHGTAFLRYRIEQYRMLLDAGNFRKKAGICAFLRTKVSHTEARDSPVHNT